MNIVELMEVLLEVKTAAMPAASPMSVQLPNIKPKFKTEVPNLMRGGSPGIKPPTGMYPTVGNKMAEALGVLLGGMPKEAFWTGALGGPITGSLIDAGQRAAVRNADRELTDEEYNRATGGFANAAAPHLRALGHGLLGAGAGALIGGGLGAAADQYEDHGQMHPDAAIGAFGGGMLGSALGYGHGAYTSARDKTEENIEHIDEPGSVSSRHPVATGVGGATRILGALSNPVSLGVALGSGTLGHGIGALRGRAHSQTGGEKPDTEAKAAASFSALEYFATR